MHTEEIEYDADGMRAVGYLALPDGDDARPGVLVSHEGPGMDDHAKSRARRIATELGYVAFVLDYIGGGERVDMSEIGARLGPLMTDPLKTRRVGQAGLALLTSQARVDTARLAAIGYCFGGTMSLELARGGAPFKAVVGFHSGLGTARPDDAKNITGKVLVCIGAEDPIIPPEQRLDFEREMRAGNVDWRMNLYGGAAHSFTNPAASDMGMPGIAYHADTDRRSWAAMVDLFTEVFV